MSDLNTAFGIQRKNTEGIMDPLESDCLPIHYIMTIMFTFAPGESSFVITFKHSVSTVDISRISKALCLQSEQISVISNLLPAKFHFPDYLMRGLFGK